MNRSRIVALTAVALLVLATAGIAWAQTSASFDNRWHVLGAGGSHSVSSAGHMVRGTLGQLATGISTNAGAQVAGTLSSGFWTPLEVLPPGLYLPLVVRS